MPGVRVGARGGDEFEATRSLRRAMEVNGDLVARRLQATPTSEQYSLFRAYIDARHADGGMADMTVLDYAMMVEDSIIDTFVTEYRPKPKPLGSAHARQAQPLLGVALCDRLSDGISMVYSFYEPEPPAAGLGTYMILEHIAYARRLGVPYLYLGYWIQGSPKMSYKKRLPAAGAAHGQRLDAGLRNLRRRLQGLPATCGMEPSDSSGSTVTPPSGKGRARRRTPTTVRSPPGSRARRGRGVGWRARAKGRQHRARRLAAGAGHGMERQRQGGRGARAGATRLVSGSPGSRERGEQCRVGKREAAGGFPAAACAPAAASGSRALRPQRWRRPPAGRRHRARWSAAACLACAGSVG